MRITAKQFIKNTLLVVCTALTFSVLSQDFTALSQKTTASFRSMHVLSDTLIWAGGSGGTVVRSLGGIHNWQVFRLGDKYDFRGIHAFNENVAVAMSSGDAKDGLAKIFRTTDGGDHWEMMFEAKQPGVFLDCLKFVDAKTGYVLGDPIGGKPYLLKTKNGGKTWRRLPPGKFPDVVVGEASFAASNSNISLVNNRVLFSTQSRIFISENEGKSWRVVQTPFQQGETSGIFGIYFTDEQNGLAVGGDYVDDKSKYPNIAKTTDGGSTWEFLEPIEPYGLKESIAYSPMGYIAVGTSGVSKTRGTLGTWVAPKATDAYHVVQCTENGCYMIGGKGRFGFQRRAIE